jgi:hypothetical protein
MHRVGTTATTKKIAKAMLKNSLRELKCYRRQYSLNLEGGSKGGIEQQNRSEKTTAVNT